MTDKPIIFSAPMIRALLAGTKTQTRRVLKAEVPEAPGPDKVPYLDSYNGQRKTVANPRGASENWCWWTRDNRQCLPTFKVPYVAGDRLWVREQWKAPIDVDQLSPSKMDQEMPVLYLADCEPVLHGELSFRWGRCRASMFLPRHFSRLTLIVTAVRVQRLQDISEADAFEEGAEPIRVPPDGGMGPFKEGYQAFWNSLHGPAAWDKNPCVAAITFETHRCNIDAMENAGEAMP